MFTAMFWRRTTERAVKSFAQSLAALLSAAGLGLFDAPLDQGTLDRRHGRAAVGPDVTGVHEDRRPGEPVRTPAAEASHRRRVRAPPAAVTVADLKTSADEHHRSSVDSGESIIERRARSMA